MGGGCLTGPYIGPASLEEGSTEGDGELLRDRGAEGGAGTFFTSSTPKPPRRVFAILLSSQENLFSRA
jgi:hypothetical protein